MSAASRPSPRISYLVKWVERGLRVQLDAALAPHGLTTPEYTALSVLRQRDGLSSAQLARRTLVTAQAMNQLVISLERRRFITRTPDLANARVQKASLTAKARRLLDTCDDATSSIEARLLSGLSRSEIQAMRRGLESCIESLGEPVESAVPPPEAPRSALRKAVGDAALHEGDER
jgi:DNA-binding MarR family transcriptional regulator